MPLRPATTLVAIAGAIVLWGTAAAAQQPNAAAPPHVRGTGEETAGLLKQLVDQSATARNLVDRLERSDVIVYIRHEWFPTVSLRGRIGFLTSSTIGRRMLVIELASRYTRVEQLAALGHELKHACEIADAPGVYDAHTLADLYRKIGDPTGHLGNSVETYETAAAAATGRRVRNEITGAPAPADVALDDDRN